MIRFRILVAVLLLVAGAASAQYAENCRNGIGLFTASPVSPAAMQDYTDYSGTPGVFSVYGILFNPHDDNTGLDLTSVGGYELRLMVPPDVYILETTLPAGASRTESAFNDFLVTMDAPVVSNQCLLFTLSLGAFDGNPGFIYLFAPSAGASLPGEIAILGTGPDAQPSRAYPVSGDVNLPVFGMWSIWDPLKTSAWTPNCDTTVPNEATSFGALKALYR